MIPDFVKIRAGTQPLTAVKKIAKVMTDFVLSNSKRLKVDKTILVRFSTTNEEIRR
jgi:hypothetical protein